MTVDRGGGDSVDAVQVSYELAVPLDQMPATTPFATGLDLLQLLNIMANLEQVEGGRPRNADWRLVAVTSGSARLRSISNPDTALRAALSLVLGFNEAEESDHLPRDWSLLAGKRAEKVAARLGETAETGLHLAVTGTQPADVKVTRRASRHLKSATNLRLTSYGTVVGVLGRVTAHKGRRAAALWSSLDGRRIEVRFGEQHVEDIRDAWAHAHVEATGVLHENVSGQILRVDVDSLEVLQSTKASLVEDLPRGFYPEMTGGQSTAQYLKAIRGED